MADLAFIRFRLTPTLAQDLDESPEVEQHYYGQIQLKPLDPYPYYQVTNSTFDMPVDPGTYSVALVNSCTLEEEDVSDNVEVTNFEENGITQMKVRIAYLPTDHYSDLMYLKIDGGSLSSERVYYSNLFLVTDLEIERTTRIDYVDTRRDIPTSNENTGVLGYIQSIRVQIYKKNGADESVVERYRQMSRGQNVIPRVLRNKLIEWTTQEFNYWTYERVMEALFGVCYFDFVRQYPFNTPEYNPREELSNISEMRFITDPDESDVINIQQVIVGASLVDFDTTETITINFTTDYNVTQIQIPA